jgi:hypothetical protein
MDLWNIEVRNLLHGKSTMSSENDKTCLGKVMWGRFREMGSWNLKWGRNPDGHNGTSAKVSIITDFEHYKITFLNFRELYVTVFHSKHSAEIENWQRKGTLSSADHVLIMHLALSRRSKLKCYNSFKLQERWFATASPHVFLASLPEGATTRWH